MKKILDQALTDRLRDRFERLYPEHVEQSMNRLMMMIGRYGVGYGQNSTRDLWNQKDAVLITYGDSVKSDDISPLQTLRRFATRHFMGAFSTIHILPFYPYSSDDGFSVINYRKVDPELGDWRDVNSLKDHFDLMFDWVLNHVSAKSSWFRDYRNCVMPYRDFFIEETSDTDLSQVTRPRTSPLLTAVATKGGEKKVWTTFSADQVDLNWSNPDVFFEMLDILFGYIANGARIVRLDAVAFLWKQIETSCLHLDETHEVVRLLHDILRIAAPSVVILTETNVPHEENISYFGQGDEAHMVYQFTLPPLLLHGLLKGTAKHVTEWANDLPELPPSCTFFNFTASHDGIGVRPLEGILPSEEIDFLGDSVKKRGGRLSLRTKPDGSQSVYEMNVTYFSALSSADDEDAQIGESRFLCSQLIAIALKGIPGIYLHSLTATENDYQGVEESGMARRINRRKWNEEELERHLKNSQSHHHRIFFKFLEILRRRARCEAFHPDASQEVLNLDNRLFTLVRKDRNSNSQVLCINNLSNTKVEIEIAHLVSENGLHEMITDSQWQLPTEAVSVKPYQTIWLSSHCV